MLKTKLGERLKAVTFNTIIRFIRGVTLPPTRRLHELLMTGFAKEAKREEKTHEMLDNCLVRVLLRLSCVGWMRPVRVSLRLLMCVGVAEMARGEQSGRDCQGGPQGTRRVQDHVACGRARCRQKRPPNLR
jgi:hypothetical protein